MVGQVVPLLGNLSPDEDLASLAERSDIAALRRYASDVDAGKNATCCPAVPAHAPGSQGPPGGKGACWVRERDGELEGLDTRASRN